MLPSPKRACLSSFLPPLNGNHKDERR
jgi:hypothetical protein